MIPLDAIVGTVDRRHGEFDRAFRPSPNTRGRWERIAEARKRGEAMPPIDVFKIGDLYFVQDGHHRVSVARAMGDKDINANVIEVRTKLGAGRELQMSDLPLKRHERVFHERVPLPPAMRERIQLSDEWRYAQLATLIESWGYRASLERERVMDRPELALRWFREEYEPMVAMLREAEIGGGGTETERYLRVVDAALPAAPAPRLVGGDGRAAGGRGQVTEPGRGEGHDDAPDHQGDAGLASSRDRAAHVALDLGRRQRAVVDADLVDARRGTTRARCRCRRSAATPVEVRTVPVSARLATWTPLT